MAEPRPGEEQVMLHKFFTALAQQDYDKQTGHTTGDLISQVLDSVPLGINSYSRIHDNACGPGTATEELVKLNLSRDILPCTIEATDSNEAMIEALNKTKSQNNEWRQVTAKVMDSHVLGFPDESFTHSICNFSVFTFNTPLKCLFEVHRTLKHRGIAVITCWKRFGVGDVIHQAQKSIKPDGPLMPVAKEEFMREGYLPKLVEAAEFERGKIKVMEKRVIVGDGPKLDTLVQFMSGEFTAPARVGWTDEEKSKWPAAIKTAVEEEKKANGGLLMEAWVVIAQKWDKMSA